jgi:hypothetical protein
VECAASVVKTLWAFLTSKEESYRIDATSSTCDPASRAVVCPQEIKRILIDYRDNQTTRNTTKPTRKTPKTTRKPPKTARKTRKLAENAYTRKPVIVYTSKRPCIETPLYSTSTQHYDIIFKFPNYGLFQVESGGYPTFRSFMSGADQHTIIVTRLEALPKDREIEIQGTVDMSVADLALNILIATGGRSYSISMYNCQNFVADLVALLFQGREHKVQTIPDLMASAVTKFANVISSPLRKKQKTE